jgi:hypothetical protein
MIPTGQDCFNFAVSLSPQSISAECEADYGRGRGELVLLLENEVLFLGNAIPSAISSWDTYTYPIS